MLAESSTSFEYSPSVLVPPSILRLRDQMRELYEDARSRTFARVDEWTESIHVYRGNQNGRTVYGSFIPASILDRAPNEEVDSHNFARAFVRSAVADMLRYFPQPDVYAASDDQMSIARAETKRRLLQSFIYSGVLSYEQVYRTELSANLFGIGILKAVFDPRRGRKIGEQPMMRPSPAGPWMEPQFDMFGRPKTQKFFEGEIVCRSFTPFEVFLNPDARTREDVDMVFQVRTMPLRTALKKYPTDMFGQPTNGRWAFEQSDFFQMQRDEATRSNDYGWMTPSGSPLNQTVQIIEAWEKPTEDSDGILLMWSGSVILYAGPPPHQWPWIVRTGQNMVPDEVIADGMMRDLKPMQRSYNRSWNKSLEWMDRVVHPMLLAPRGAELDLSQFSDIAGAAVEYEMGFRPEWMNPPSINQSLFEMSSAALTAMKDVTTYSDVSRGALPQGANSGKTIAYLSELEQNAHGPDIQFFRIFGLEALQTCGKIALQTYQEGRMIKILGENKAPMMIPLRKADIDDDFDLVTEVFDGPPLSRAVRDQTILDGITAGIYADLPPAQIRAMLGQASADRDTTDPAGDQISAAKSENISFFDNPLAPLEVLEAELHEIHIDEHNKARRSPRYRLLPPELRANIDLHVQQHELLRSWQLQGFVAEQAMLGGGSMPMGPEGGGMQTSDGGSGASQEFETMPAA